MSNLHWLNKLKQFRVALNSNDFGFSQSGNWWLNSNLEGNSVYIAKANLGNHGNNMSFANSKRKINLLLTECYGFKSFTRFEGFSQLSFLEVEMCDEIDYLIDGDFSNNSFESLEELKLIELRGMKNILRGETSSTSLGRLRFIRIKECPNITTVFPASLLFPKARLQDLEDVRVRKCDLLQNIFNTEGEEGLAEGSESNSYVASPGEGLLPGIHSITLSGLPEMMSIWKGVVPSGSLQGLTELDVSSCHSLTYLLSSDMVRCLQNLEKIDVNRCSKMEKLIQFTCEEAKETCLGKLRYISITDCPSIIPSHLHFLEERHKSHELEVVGYDAAKHIYNEIPWSYQFPSIKITFESFFLLEEELRSDNSSLQLTATTQFREMQMMGWDESKMLEVIKSGVLSRFVDFAFRDDFPELQYEAVNFLANLVSSGTSDFIKIVIDHGVVPIFVKLLSSRSDQIKEQALRALGNIAGGSPDWRDLFLEHDVLPGLVSLLRHPYPSVLVPALWTIADIIRKDSMHIQCILDHQVLPYLLNVLTEFKYMQYLKKATLSIISCITEGSEIQIQAVITSNIIGLLVQQSETAKFDIKKEAVWVIANAICGGSWEQIKNLVSLGCITPICDLLLCPDSKLVVACLRALDKILKIGKTEIPIGKDGVSNLYMQLTGDCGGLEKIKNLRGHEITEIHEKAVNILKIYWLQEDALPYDDKFAQADFQYGENELPVPSGAWNEASRPSFPMGVVKDFQRGTEQREEWKMENEELEGGTEERESEQDTMPYEIDSNKSSSEDVTVDFWSNDAYKTKNLNFEIGCTSEDKESANELTSIEYEQSEQQEKE